MVGEGDVGGPGGAVPSGRIAVWSTISHVELVGRGAGKQVSGMCVR